jgi:hypothetical protein
LAEGFGADDAPGLFDETAADPELQCFFDEGEMLLVLVSNAMTPRSDETGH